MPTDQDIRAYQGKVFRRYVSGRRWSFRRLSRISGLPYPAVRKYASGHSVLDCYLIARLAHVRDLSDKAVRELVDGTALRLWYANPKDRPHPFSARGDE